VTITIVTGLAKLRLHGPITTGTVKGVASSRAIITVLGVPIVTDLIRLHRTVSARSDHGAAIHRAIITIDCVAIIT
jgi:hypothetical protein